MPSYADAIRTYPGALNNDIGTYEKDNALFLKVFAGEVLTAFEETNVFKPLHLVRTITHGKSASFPATWKATARYHTPGTPILGSNQIKTGERVITIDDLLIADVFIYNLDEAKNHYDVRQIYSTELGRALARAFDTRLARVAVLTARASATITGAPGGTQLKNPNYPTDGELLANAAFNVQQIFDEKDVPENDRYLVLRPAQYYLLAQTTKVLNRDWGGSGAYADGSVLKVAGLTIIKSNHIPNDNYAGTEGERNNYAGNFTNTVAVAFHKSAFGTVKLMDLALEQTGQDFRVMYQGDMMVAKYAMGHGILRPECAVEISKAAS